MKRFIEMVGLVIFSFLIWTLSFLFMAVLAVVTFLLSPIVPYRRSHSWIAAPGFSLIARATTLGQFQITYDPRFDPDRRSVFCMNHTNLIDAHVAAATIPHTFCGLMNAWQAKIPFYGWLMKLSKGIFVQKGESNKAILDQISRDAKSRIEEGFSILAFPEAHRTRDGKIGPFKRGIFRMARATGAPVVMLAAHGMYRLNQRGSRLFRPTSVHAYVGPQIETKGLSDAQLERLIDSMRASMINVVEHGESPVEKEAVAACAHK